MFPPYHRTSEPCPPVLPPFLKMLVPAMVQTPAVESTIWVEGGKRVPSADGANGDGVGDASGSGLGVASGVGVGLEPGRPTIRVCAAFRSLMSAPLSR